MRKKVKILQVVREMGPAGLEHVVLDLIDHIDKDMFDSYLLCIHEIQEPYREKLATRNIPFTMIQIGNGNRLNFFKKLISFLRVHRFDVVHIHSGCFVESMLPTKLAGVRRTIFTAHGLPIRSRLSFIEEPISALLVDKITAVSQEVGVYLKKNLPLSREKIEVIPNGVDLNRFQPAKSAGIVSSIRTAVGLPNEAIIIGSVGRLQPIKNYGMLVRAFEKVYASTKKPVHLALVGDGGERHTLEELCTKIGIKKQVTFLGIRDNIHELLKAFDVFALSSFTEGTSISLLESQATGLPAVVTDVGGNSTIVDNGRSGFLVANDDEVEMSAKLARMLDRKLRLKMGNRARKRMEHEFDLPKVVGKYQQLYLQPL